MTMRLLLLEPNIVFTARVAQASFEYPIAEVAYDTGVEFDDVLEGYTVMFGTSAGSDDLGRQRIRGDNTVGASGTLKFGRSSTGVLRGEVRLQDNAYITVLELREVWGIFPNEDGFPSFKDEDIAYVDQNEEPPPVANAGIGYARSLSGGTSINCDFDGTGSFATADGATISTYAWNVDDGTITVGDVDSDSITANFPVGFRYVSLTVTDSNGKSHTTYVPVYCEDPSNPGTVQNFTIEQHRRTAEGQEMAFRILDDIPASTHPNGTLVMLWEGEPSSNSDRSHMRFTGWHQSDPASIRAERTGTLKDTTLNCFDVAGMMKLVPSFPVEITGVPDPENWNQMLTPNMDKYLHFLLHWHSTALNLTDWTWTGTGSTFAFVIMGSDGESLWEQVQSKAKAMVPDRVLTCNRFGQLATQTDPMLQDTGDRTAAAQTTLDDSDISEISWQAQNFPRVHWLRGSAILAHASAIEPVFCIAPGTAPGQGLVEQPSGEQLAESQATLNACEGHRYARLNAPNSLFTILSPGDDMQHTDPAVMQWVTLTIPSDIKAQRGLTLTAARGLAQEVNIQYEQTRTGLVRTVEIQWEQETDGEPAVTEVVEADEIPDPEWDPGDDPGYDDDPGPDEQGDGFGTVYARWFAELHRTRDLSAASPSWVDITPGGGAVGTMYDFILDPWAPTERAIIYSADGVYVATNMDEASPTWTLELSAATIETAVSGSFENQGYIRASINEEGYVAFMFNDYTNGGKKWYVYTENIWATTPTWNYVLVYTAVGHEHSPAFDISPRSTPGNHIIYAYTDGAANADASYGCLHKSIDNGATWSNGPEWVESAGPGVDETQNGPVAVHVPFHNNGSSLVYYYSFRNYSGSYGGATWKVEDGSIDNTGHAHLQPTGIDKGTGAMRQGIETYTQDNQRIVLWDTRGGILYISTNGGTSWNAPALNGLSGTITGCGGFPFNGEQYYALTNEGVFVTTDGGENWTNKNGDLSPVGSAALRSQQYGTIVPVWVAE